MEKLATNPIATIDSLSHEGRGIAHLNGKITFIENALPGEKVIIQITKKHRQFDEAKTLNVIQAASERVEAKCHHFHVCGGCSLQHLDIAKQIALKEQILLEQLQAQGITPQHLTSPLTAASWHYRRRARLGVKYVIKKQAVLVGFREKNGRYLAELKGCETLAPSIANLLLPLQSLISSLQNYQSIPQIEAALGDSQLGLIFRHLSSLSEEDLAKLKTFAQKHQLQLYLQSKGEDSIHCVWPENPLPLSYTLHPSHWIKKRLELLFKPQHFIQINAAMNQLMIDSALSMLKPDENDHFLDLFCGLGNFSLPLALRCKNVIGIEGATSLVAQARENALYNKIDNVKFYMADLTQAISVWSWSQQPFNKLLLDPPRSGALEILRSISNCSLERIVYISCNSATLARDARELVNQGYRLEQAGILNMFPHTSHSEAICLFIK